MKKYWINKSDCKSWTVVLKGGSVHYIDYVYTTSQKFRQRLLMESNTPYFSDFKGQILLLHFEACVFYRGNFILFIVLQPPGGAFA